MMKIPEEIVIFFHKQGFVIVNTVDKDGYPHSACKGIVDIDKAGRVYLLDLYRAETHANLARSAHLSITAIDEHNFKGYCLKGRATIQPERALSAHLLKAWEDRITNRLTQRLLKNIRGEKGHLKHPEALLPKPQYLIEMEVEGIIDLMPRHMKGI